MPDSSFQPFMSDGIVLLTSEPDDNRSVCSLCDTGGSQSMFSVFLYAVDVLCSSLVQTRLSLGFLFNRYLCLVL